MEKLSRREREKLRREADILTAAEKLFAQHGFDQISMDTVAKEAEFTKRTLYQYFTSKEDLYFAVALKGFQQMFRYIQDAAKQGETGFEKVRQACLAYYRFYQDFPESFRLMNYVGYVKTNRENSPKRQEWMQFDNQLFRAMAQLIEAGKADGSIRSDLDATQGAYALAFITTGFFHILAETGTTFTTHFALDQEAFSVFALDLLLDSIRRRESPPNT